MQTIQDIDTRPLNEMSQQLTSILQKLSASNHGGPFQSPRIRKNCNPNSAMLPLSRPMKLDFPRFSSEELAS